jgi:DNA-binding response OmpR family regulator
MKILLVEDDEGVAEVLEKALSAQHYLVDLATDGQVGWELTEVLAYDLILLDVGLPKLDGIGFCQRLRAQGDRTPILLLTAQDASNNKVTGLDAGADDYLVKPYDFNELLARIRALLRRGSLPASPVLEWNSLRLAPSTCEVTYNGQLLHLTAKEYTLLELFLRNPHRIFSQSALLDRLWSFEEYPHENTVRAHVKSLRQKLKKAGAAADFIETLYGLGYRLKSSQDIDRQQNKVENELNILIPSELSAIWERSREKYLNRLQVLERAIKALREDKLDRILQQDACQEAHTLKGSLGSFGLSKGERLSREIEQMFKAGVSQIQINELSKLVRALRQEIEKPVVPTESPKPLLNLANQRSRLLIVDDDVELSKALSLEAAVWGIKAESVGDIPKARSAIACQQPDIVLLDLKFPNSTDNGLKLLEELAQERSPVPVVVFTGAENFEDRVKVARLGARGFLQKPSSSNQVMEKITQILQQSSFHKAKLLIVDDDPQMLDFLRRLLEPWGYNLTLLDDPKQFWEMLTEISPDLLILDLEMPEFNGIDLCQVVRNETRWSNLPILFLSAHTDAQIVHQVFTVGADDFVNKPIVESELLTRIWNRLERTQRLRKLLEK